MGILDRDYPGAYAYGYPQEVRTLTEIDTIEGRISNQDNDKLEYTLDFFSRDSQTFTTYDLDRSYVVTEVFPTLMKPIVGFDYKTPFNACNAARLTQQFCCINCVSILVLLIPLMPKLRQYLQTLNTIYLKKHSFNLV